MKTVQYSSDLTVPQAEVDLEELYEFLLDRGTVPDVKGIHMLRVSGLWTPTGTSLMLSPDSKQTALRIVIIGFAMETRMEQAELLIFATELDPVGVSSNVVD
ncbi:MAG: hypothetical protein LQ349_009729 [Xanthoria aureola]|nr:MAG: hypothetical protein LQ349_009729 [Xanthoria aureola]